MTIVSSSAHEHPSSAPPERPPADPIEPRRFTAEEVLRLTDLGFFAADDHLELIQGSLLVVNPQGPSHATVITRLNRRLVLGYEGASEVRPQCPVEAGPENLPEPDLAVVRPGDYAERHPNGEDVILAIEVARTSHALDRLKVGVYARAGVGVYWLLDLCARRLEVRTGPLADGEYETTRLLGEDDEVELPEVGGSVAVRALLDGE